MRRDGPRHQFSFPQVDGLTQTKAPTSRTVYGSPGRFGSDTRGQASIEGTDCNSAAGGGDAARLGSLLELGPDARCFFFVLLRFSSFISFLAFATTEGWALEPHSLLSAQFLRSPLATLARSVARR